MKRKILSWLAICFMIVSICFSIRAGMVQTSAKAKNHSYVAYTRGEDRKTHNVVKIKNNKLMVTGTFYDLKKKKPWKYPVKMKNKKFTISKNVRYERELDGYNNTTNKKDFLKNYNNYASIGFEVKNGKVIMIGYSEFEPEF